MTGFGRATGDTLLGTVTVEVRSINHRYLDMSLRTPRDISFLDEEIKSMLRERISRGRLEVTVRLQSDSTKESGALLNVEQIRSYLEALNGLKQELGLSCEVKFEDLLSLPGVLIEKSPVVDDEHVAEQVKEVVSEALIALIDSREKEGQRLAQDIESRLHTIATLVAEVSDLSGLVVEAYRKRLRDNIEKLLPEVTLDQGRLETEIALFADRSNITEELVRLGAHLGNFQSFMSSKEAVGRKMDFYLQELNREVNTVGSKTPEVKVSQRVVDIKAELEKIREQVQNLE
jgi:uncharacterized protein (TIGR00255 family)